MISVGVDIGTYSIKIAEVEPTSKAYFIRRVQEFPLSLDLTKDKKIEIIDTLRNYFQNYDLDKTHFVFSMPQASVSMRHLHFPFRERFKVQKAMVSELDDDLPFSQDEAVFDSKIVRYVGKGSDVLAMAVPKDRVKALLELAHDGSAEPQFLSADSLALGNLFERWHDAPPEIAEPPEELPVGRSADLIVNIGHTTTQLLVYAEGMLVGVRNLDWGAKNLASAIGKKYGLNDIQAMNELRTKGFVLLEKSQGTKEQAAFSKVIEGSLEDLISNMRLVMLELQSEFHLEWHKGLLVGGGASLRNLGAFLTQAFSIPFNRYKQFDHHPTAGFEYTPQLELSAAVAVGLALEGLKRPRNPATNFLKGEFARQSHFFEGLWDKWRYTAQVVGVAFLIFFVYAVMRDSLSANLLDQSDQALHTQAEAVAHLNHHRATPGHIRHFLAMQDRLSRSRTQAEKVTHLNSALDILNAINAAFPAGNQLTVEIKRVSIDNTEAEIQGYTNSVRDLSRVTQLLRKLSSNGRADHMPLKIHAPAGKTPFAFRIQVQRYNGG